jgi:type III restriction enzyme
MSDFEVPEPILNSPYEKPALHWLIREGEAPVQEEGRRHAGYFYRDPKAPGTGVEHEARGRWVDLSLVNLVRERVDAWRPLALKGEGGVTRTTMELLNYWRRDGRRFRLFFAQMEAVETVIFLNEARTDFLQGIDVPLDEPSDDQKKTREYSAFRRYACKMATGTGKTTVMGMLAAWSILNKVNNRNDARFSDVVLIVCPNVTIRNRLAELDPKEDEASLYRTRDLVPTDLMPTLRQGRVLVTNWHVFEPQSVQVGGVTAKVAKAGVRVRVTERIRIGEKTTTARGKRYLTPDELQRQVNVGLLTVVDEKRDRDGSLKYVVVESVKHVESDTALINRVLGREVGGKQNILVFNDEAHHAYRIRREGPDEEEEEIEAETIGEEEEDRDTFFKEATVWIEGLDRINKLRGINFCVDLSATPYYLGRVGQETNRTFPWVVSDFGLTDAIESGLVKIPQLVVRDVSGAAVAGADDSTPSYFNIWRWILGKLTPAERGGRKGSPKPEAILKWANTPIVMLAGLWAELSQEWDRRREDARRPVFIVVCKNTRIAKTLYEWLADDKAPSGIPPVGIVGFRNEDGQINTIRVDSKVVHETDTGEAKTDESKWMRLTLDTVGKLEWPKDRQGRPIYPEEFEELAKKLDRPLHPPGRDVKCIVSVGMLTEGWDCNTVTHIIGLRPFMSQLLCEQVVGRGLRRFSYDINEKGKLNEEVAKIFGVPFEIIPFKANPPGPPPPPVKRHHVHAIPQKAEFKMTLPRVEGYQQAIRNRVTVRTDAPTLILDPLNIPPEVQVKASLPNNQGRASLVGPGRLETVDLNPFRSGRRLQELVFELAGDLTRSYVSQPGCEAPAHVLFPQIVEIVRDYLNQKVKPREPANILDVFCSPYYGWVIERLTGAIEADTKSGEVPEVPRYERNREPISTSEVDFWTSRDVRDVINSHLNYVVADTKRWEQSAAYQIDTHKATEAFVKNEGLGFAIPYFHNGQPHDYMPDFIIRLSSDPLTHLILETKGHDPLAEIKRQAAERWIAAVNADGTFGTWHYRMCRRPDEVTGAINSVIKPTEHE